MILTTGNYALGIQSSTSLWPPGLEPLPAEPWNGSSRPPSLIRRDAEHAPVSAKQLALGLPKRAWRRVTWREGGNATLASRFAAVRVRPAHRETNRTAPRAEEWCLIEWLIRVARGRARADEVLALHLDGHDVPARLGRHHQTAMAHRARLSGPQAGARPRPL